MKIKTFALSLAAALGTAVSAQAHEGASATHFATQPDHGGLIVLVLLGVLAAGALVLRETVRN